MVTQGALLADVQVQPAGVVILNELNPPVAPTFVLGGLRLYVQLLESCVTLKLVKVKNCPLLKLTEIAPVRCAPEFDAIVKLTVPPDELVTLSQETFGTGVKPPQPTD